MTKEEFNEGFGILFAAHIYSQGKVHPATQEAYWLVLRDAPVDKFHKAVVECLVDCKFFPSINEIVTAMFPPFSKLPPYNPYGNGELITLSPVDQLRLYQDKATEMRAKELVDGMIKKIE